MLDTQDIKNISDLMDKKVEDFAQIVQSGFAEMDKRFDGVDKRFDKIETDLKEVKTNIVEIKVEIIDIKLRLDSLEQRLSALEDKFEDLSLKLDKLGKVETEDLQEMSSELGILKHKVKNLELQIKKMQAAA